MRRLHLSGLVLLLPVLMQLHGEPRCASPRPGPSPAEVIPVDTPAGRAFQDVLAALNSGSAERIRALVVERFAPPFRDALPIEAHLAVFLSAFEQSGGFDFHGARRADSLEFAGIIRNRLAETWNQVWLRVEDDAPHRITRLAFGPGRPPDGLPPPPPLSPAEALSELDRFLDRLVRAGVFSGTVQIALGNAVLYRRAEGLANKSYLIPNRIDTRFNLGSMNKMFTAVVVGRLADEGVLSFDDPVSRYLCEEWLAPEFAEKITIDHLLTHTSGLGSYFNETFMKSSRDLYRRVDDYRPLVRDERPSFEPGSRWAYSNTGFLLLGAVIEKATGRDYFDVVREVIYEPAGMLDTDCYELDRPVPNLAVGYSRDYGGAEVRWTNNLFRHVLRGGPAGGGYSTAEDLVRFARALLEGRLIDPETARFLWTRRSSADEPGYGRGFSVDVVAAETVVGHGGGFPGISSNLDIYLETGYIVAVLSNYDRGSSLVHSKIRELLGRIPRR